MSLSAIVIMDFVTLRHNGYTFRVYERIFANTNTLLIGDSLVRNFWMQECDVVSISGGRAEDVLSYLRTNNLNKNHNIIVFLGGNGLSQSMKNGSTRRKMIPAEVEQDIDSIANYLHELGIRVFAVGIPRKKCIL